MLFSVLSCGNLYAQKAASAPLAGQAFIDSLLKELPKQKEDTNKVKLLNSLSYGYSKVNPDDGIKYGQQELELATKLERKKGIAAANQCLGVNYNSKSEYSRALEYYQKALEIYEDINSKQSIATATHYIGGIYLSLGDYSKALACYFKTLKMYEELENRLGVANVTADIGILYIAQGDYPKGLEYRLYFTRDKLVDCFYQRIGTSS